MNNVSSEEKFEYWLMDMEDAIDRFMHMLPSEIRDQLDYSAESLTILEAWLLEKYKNIEEIKPLSEAQIVDGAARYIGETFRKNLGGKWTFDVSDEKNAFHGLPQLTGCKNQVTQICPIKIVSVSVARRTGSLIRPMLEKRL
jgi:hypothetical protein